jgi:hypothetical protein
MPDIKKLTAAIALTLALGISALADCAPRDGIIQSPPCASAQLTSDESATQDIPTTLTDESWICLTEASDSKVFEAAQKLLELL